MNRFLTLDQLSHLPRPQWLVEGLFEVGSLTMLAGPPGSYKSFLALDWMMSMAAGRQWNGKACIPSNILYVLGEGKSSLLKRTQVWAEHHKLTPDEFRTVNERFRVCFDMPQLAVKSSVDNLLAGLVTENFKPNVVVIDTLARSFVGQDENSQKDTGLWIEALERLRTLGFTVLVIHHTALNTEFGHRPRGSSTILGAMDTAMVLVRENHGNGVKLTVTKQKDHDEGEPIHFNRVVIKPFGHEDEGSVVLVPTVSVDERFTEEYRIQEAYIKALLQDPAFDSDRARAKTLAEKHGITESAAQSRISRRRKEELNAVTV